MDWLDQLAPAERVLYYLTCPRAEVVEEGLADFLYRTRGCYVPARDMGANTADYEQVASILREMLRTDFRGIQAELADEPME